MILLDIQMPEMDGPTFAERYRRTPGSHAPIVDKLFDPASLPGLLLASVARV